MKKILFFLSLGLLTFVACNPDDNNTTTDGPVIDFVSGSGFISGNATIKRDTVFSIKIDATKGTKQLKTISILEGGVAITDFNRVQINAVNISANPTLLFNTEKDGLDDWIISIKSSSNVETVEYTVEVEDEAGLTDEINFSITTFGTVVIESSALQVNNLDGPDKSGVDLSNFKVVVSSDATANIKDLGNAINSTNWLHRIGGTNGAKLRNFPASVTYLSLKFSDDIKAAYNAGTDAANNDVLCDPTTEFLVNVGNTEYYAIKVASVIESNTDNRDYTVIKVKK